MLIGGCLEIWEIPIIFSKSDNSDLFYAIHKFSYTYSGSSYGARFVISDVFDFSLKFSYQDLFTTIVNNWAYLNQHMGVLYPVRVKITLDV